MNIRCEQFDELLLDGERLAMETAARHAQSCPACLEKLTGWNEISDTAQSLQTSWNSDLLWPRIQRSLKEEARRSSKSRVWSIAAAAILTISIVASTWYAVRIGSKEAGFDQDILRVSALDDVQRAEQAHVDAIARLEKLAAQKLDEPATPLLVNYKEKLMLLDDAIAECETQIQQNRQNAHLRKQLLAIYTEKQQTLSAVVREGTNATNQ